LHAGPGPGRGRLAPVGRFPRGWGYRPATLSSHGADPVGNRVVRISSTPRAMNDHDPVSAPPTQSHSHHRAYLRRLGVGLLAALLTALALGVLAFPGQSAGSVHDPAAAEVAGAGR
jgi:hypothetical protein